MSPFRLFVYGTLKYGYGNHKRFCQGVRAIEPATVRGRLYELPVHFPMLMVPEEDILACGTADPAADRATQVYFSTQTFPPISNPKNGPWNVVHGEVLTFDDPGILLLALDRLEGFQPAGSSFYYRVLLRMNDPAWTYIGLEVPRAGRHLANGIWPPQP